jgi:peptidyl-prolyl cis-trans isomerase SurA
VTWSKRWTLGGLLALTILLVPWQAHAIIVERVVAVVGEKAILLTDLRKRARPFLVQSFARLPVGPQRAAAESRVLGQVIERIVAEELEATAAAQTNTRATADEVDKALRNIARASGGVTLSELFENIRRDTGMTEVEYRGEIRRQVLEGKLLNRMVQNQRITQKELREVFEKVTKQERNILLYQPAWIVLRLGKNPSKDLVKARMVQARQIVASARGGSDFGSLAQQHSEDPKSQKKGGALGLRAAAGSPKARSGRYKPLARALERRAMALKPGEVTEPFRYQDALAILTLVSRQPSRYTTLEAASQEMFERVRGAKLQKVRTKWLKDLRRRTHVDVRL